MIDIKDLMPITNVKEIPENGTFYRKDADGHHTATRTKFKDVNANIAWMRLTMEYIREKRLFRRRSAPFRPFI